MCNPNLLGKDIPKKKEKKKYGNDKKMRNKEVYGRSSAFVALSTQPLKSLLGLSQSTPRHAHA